MEHFDVELAVCSLEILVLQQIDITCESIGHLMFGEERTIKKRL